MKKYLGTIALIMVLAPAAVVAQATPNVYTHKMGAVSVSLLSEGQGSGNSSIFVGATPEMIQKSMPEGSYPRSTNAFLIRLSGKIILVDTGTGRNLLDNLKTLGVAPEQIDAVLITHVHGDHTGGMLKDGQAAFPNAELYLSTPEHDFAMNGEARNANARRMIEVYKSKLRLFQPTEIDETPHFLFPGIQAIAAYGHTPGHTLYMVDSGGEKLLVWGDLTHAMAIQMPFPQVAMTYDVNPDMAIAARKKVLVYVAKNNITVAGIHTAFPGMGKLTKAAEGGYIHTPLQ